MANISLCDYDTAGGTIKTAGRSKVKVGGYTVALVGDPIVNHGNGAHGASSITQGSSKFKINGIPVAFAGCGTSCGHVTTGRMSKFSVSS